MGGWIRLETVSPRFSCMYEEGGGVNNLAFFTGMGGCVVAGWHDSA